MKINKIVIGSDHAGYELKAKLVNMLKERGIDVSDVGTNSSDSVDYPDYAHTLANMVEGNQAELGISICGSGNGINMATNKHQGIRGALCWNKEIATLARSHNNANVCSLPARFISEEEARQIVDAFLSTPFDGGRHETRINKIPVNQK